MTVAELIEELQGYPGDMKVVLAHPSHDYWNTELAGDIRHVEENYITYSDYHRKDKVTEDPDDEEVLLIKM